MNLFNRIAMVILLLFGILLSIVVVSAAIYPGETLDGLVSIAESLSDSMTMGLQILVASAAALVAIACFLLLLLEIVPRSAKGVRLTGVTGASAELTVDAIVNRIRYEVEGVPEVRQVRPSVSTKGKAVDVTIQLFTDLTSDVAAKAEEVSQIVRDTVENKLGVKLRNLHVYVRQDFDAKAAKAKATSQQSALSETRPSEPK